MPSIRKILQNITPQDVLQLCEQRWLEDEHLELKEDLPAKKDRVKDSWYGEPRVIGEYARNRILEEVIALANSYGGDVIVGIAETRDKPPRAEKINPIPDCIDLAERLAQQSHACIDPPIPSLQTRGIPTEPDGSGVVIIRVTRSRAAPHRHEITKECYHRVRSETHRMTMRQIHDLTFAVARGLDAVEKRLSTFKADLHTWTPVDRISPFNQLMALRVSAVPATSDIYLDHVHGIQEVAPSTAKFQLISWNDTIADIFTPLPLTNWRPILRGTEASATGGSDRQRGQIFCDGSASMAYSLVLPVQMKPPVQTKPGIERDFLLNPGWLLGLAACVIDTAGKIRTFAGTPAAEYALEIEVATSADLPVVSVWEQWSQRGLSSLVPGSYDFPRYLIGPTDTWNETIRLIHRDLWHLVRIDIQDEVRGIKQWARGP